MNICDLPDDVLRLVLFQASVVDDRDLVKSVKESLLLLAVCQRWRCLALPCVYDKVHIRYGNKLSFRPRNAVADTGNDAVTSNLALVATFGRMHTVKSLKINVHYALNPFPGLTRVVRKMQEAAEVWEGARVLNIDLHPSYNRYNHKVNVAVYAENSRQICAALGAMLPRICRVSFGGMNYNYVGREFFGQLAEVYSGQLRGIFSTHPVTVSPGCLFRQLRQARISYNSRDDYQLPRMDPANLEYLALLNWPANHSWAPFGADGSSGEITFPRLQRLRVFYSHEGTADGRLWMLHFPALRSLELSCFSAACPLLGFVVLPPRMEKIAIATDADALRHAPEIASMAAEHFSLKIQDRGAGTPPALAAAALAAAKRISSRVQGAKTLELDVGSCLAQVPPESIACASLTRLVVGAAATLDMILRLIRALPNLDSLVLYELASNETPASMSAPAPGTGYAVEPLGTRLKVLSINARQGDPSWKMAVPVAKCLLLRIPTLDTFSAIYAPAKPIMYFVRECSKWYPHLARIRFFLDSSNGSSENQRAGGAVTDP